jgi:integrase
MAKKMKGVTCINRNGATYWYARVDGQRVYCGKGDRGYKVAVAARSKYVARRYETREMTAGLKVRKAEFKTVRDLSNWYMQLPKVQQLASYERKVFASVHLLNHLGSKRLVNVDADTLEQYRERRTREGAQSGTIDYEIGALSAMYHLAMKRKKIQGDLVPGEFPIVREVNPRRIVTEEEFGRLHAAADKDFADVLLCGYETAMRSGEICKLTAGQVRLKIAHISGAVVDYIDLGIFDTKTGARRTVPVSARLGEVLERRLQGLRPDDYVFTYRGYGENRKPFTPVAVSIKFKQVCKDAGVVHGDKALNAKGERIGITFHCLRHTRTTRWVEMGFSDEIIRRATGHRTLAAYQNYVKLDPAVVMRLVDGSGQRHKNGIKSSQAKIASES